MKQSVKNCIYHFFITYSLKPSISWILWFDNDETFENTESEGTYVIECATVDLSGNISKTLSRLAFVIHDTFTSIEGIEDNGFAVFPTPLETFYLAIVDSKLKRAVWLLDLIT